MDGEENEQMGVGEDCVCFDVVKEYFGEEDDVLWPPRPVERYGEKTEARKEGRHAETGQTSNDLVAGASQLATDRETHSSADNAT